MRALAAWLLLVLAAALCHLLAALLDRSGRIRLRHWAEEAGGALRALYGRPEQLLAFRSLLAWLAVALPVFALPFAWRALGGFGLAVALTVLLLAAAELASRLAVGRLAEEALRACAWIYRVLVVPLRPLLGLVSRLRASRRPEAAVSNGEDEVSEDEIEAFLDVGAAEGILEPEQEDLVARVIDFGDTVVRSVITPRTDIVGAPEDSELDDLTRLFLASRHSRLPLYRDSIDHVTGILHIRELLGALRSASPPSASELAHRPYFVPDSKSLQELLKELQAQRQQMAIVVDEFGSTVGLVTLEDVLEEIVGEITDEHEEAATEREPAGEGAWRLDGGASLQVLEELFDVDVAEEPYETVSGLVFGLLGDVPRVGDRIVRLGLEFLVEQVAERRVRKVLVRRRPASAAGG